MAGKLKCNIKVYARIYLFTWYRFVKTIILTVVKAYNCRKLQSISDGMKLYNSAEQLPDMTYFKIHTFSYMGVVRGIRYWHQVLYYYNSIIYQMFLALILQLQSINISLRGVLKIQNTTCTS